MSTQIAGLTDRLLKIRQEMQQPGSTDLPRYLAASDLHGNVLRLEEILSIAERQNVAQIFLVGDIYSGSGGWAMYELLNPLMGKENVGEGRIVPMWGNHELAFVVGMLGSDRQMRFFYGFGGRELIIEMNLQLKEIGRAPVAISGEKSPTHDDLKAIRASSELREMATWIQSTHRLFARDDYGTGYLHACPKINRHGRLDIQYAGIVGFEALREMEQDLRTFDRPNHPVVSPLLQTDNSPLWALFEISTTKQFETAFQSGRIRRLIFGHRHRAHPVNIGKLNRQFGIAVEFDKGLGGYLLIDAGGLTFHNFIECESQRTEASQLVAASGNLDARETFLGDMEEFWVCEFIEAKREFFAGLPANSTKYRQEFNALEDLRQQDVPWIPRLYAEVYANVKDVSTRKAMFSSAVKSSDEEAFRSLIHLLYQKTRELTSFGGDWYGEQYLEAKSVVEAVLDALREMPLQRLGLFDVKIRGTTSRFNLLFLYRRILRLPDPDLAVMAVENLGALELWEADQDLRTAFFHDVRKVRVRAAVALAERGEVAYPLVASLLISRDNWVRFLAYWTIGHIGMRGDDTRQQAIADLARVLGDEQDWLIRTTGKELLRMLGDPGAGGFPSPQKIPDLTDSILETLQMLVESQNEPFRKMFKVYYITVVLSSIVYRRGLIGLDIDELRIYVNRADYFPPQFRTYKSGDRDRNGNWQGWRRLWIRGETLNRPDAPQIIELSPAESEVVPTGRQTIVLYNHLTDDGRIRPPELQAIIDEHGLGKVKDRVRHWMLEHWDTGFNEQQRGLLSRLHAAATVKMLFGLTSKMFVSRDELATLETLADKSLDVASKLPKPLLSLHNPTKESGGPDLPRPQVVVEPNWIDAIKYPVSIYVNEDQPIV